MVTDKSFFFLFLLRGSVSGWGWLERDQWQDLHKKLQVEKAFAMVLAAARQH